MGGNKGKDYSKNEDNNRDTEKEITNLLIKQIQNPTIDFQFGEVQEILDELNKTKSNKKEESISTHVKDEINKEQVLKQSEFDFKVSKSLKNTSSEMLHVNKTNLLKDSETVETENLESSLEKPEHIKEGKEILSKAKRKKKNKKSKMSAETPINLSEIAMFKSNETTQDMK